MNRILTLILVLSLLSALFILQNMKVVEIRFLFWAIEMPRSLLMLLLIAIGMTIGWFLHAFFHHRARA